jgi:hypothetical protein
MQYRRTFLEDLIFGRRSLRAARTRRPKQVVLNCDQLEVRVTPAEISIAHHALAHLHHAHHSHSSEVASSTPSTVARTPSTVTGTSTSDSTDSTSSSSSSTQSSAFQTLRNDVQAIELASSTTVGELTAIRAAFEKLETDGLSPSSESALKSFENTLVTDFASGTTLTGNSTLLSQFEAIYTSSPTTQQTTDLTTAYNALAAAVTSSNITSANITTINTDWAAVLAAGGSTSTETFPYFDLVMGRSHDGGGAGECA